MAVWDSRRNNFDAIRLGLAVLVIYSHAFPLGLGSEALEPMKRLSRGQVTFGGIAVDLFFVMSGFMIAGSAHRSPSLFDFMKRRVARIYPAFILASLLALLLVVPLASARLAETSLLAAAGNFVGQTLRLREFSYSAAFAHNPYPDVINGSLWSVSYEFWCYVGVALLLLTGLLRRRMVVAGVFAAAWVASILSIVRHWNFGGKILGVIFGSPQFWARLLPLYLAGVVFYQFRERIPLRASLAGLSGAALLASCFLPDAAWTAVFPFAGTYLVFYAAFTPFVRVHSFGRFGDFSYGTYLYAFPIEQLVVQAFGHRVQPAVLFCCAAPLTLLVAVASWYGVERRFLRPARRKETVVHAVEAVAEG
jgi:peptidoglycan/LPS O-acetylase OafA/YrhL